MRDSLGRRIWRAALTGIPFGIYKIGFGWWEHHHAHPTFGLIMMLWGALDILLNLLAPAFPDQTAWCLLANLGRRVDRAARKRLWEGLLLGVDTLMSFTIVALMIWFGRLPLEPTWVATCWNIAVICNVLSVGLEQIYRAVVPAGSTGPFTSRRQEHGVEE